MKTRKMKALERRLIESLQSRFGDPESEAPTTLRDQPNEIVYTALQPKKKPEDRAGLMGMGQVPTITVEPEMGMGPGMRGDGPPTAGQLTMESMLGAGRQAQGPAQAAQQPAQQPARAPAQPSPQQAPQQAQRPSPAPQRSEEEMLQDLLVTG